MALLTALASAAGDPIAVERTILLLNRFPLRTTLFTPDADGIDELRAAIPAPVVIPHDDEPMSEHWPFSPGPLAVRVTRVRFLTGSVALVDALVQDRPALFVLRKDSTWKIASVRFLRPR